MAYYLGLDSSTQSMKAVVIDPETGCVAGGANVTIGTD